MSDIEDRLDELEDTAYLDGCALHAAMEILTIARALLKERDALLVDQDPDLQEMIAMDREITNAH
jgi:hypothetical protein